MQKNTTTISNPYSAPQSQPGEKRWRLKAVHIFVVAAIVFAVGLYFQQASKHKEAQYQREQAQMDAERAREITEVNREVMERVQREKRMEQREESGGDDGR